ncbi:hypothetical protein V2J09_008768 [Rumex salicifolius]
MDANEISLASGRFQSCLREIRIRADDIEDEEKGLKISKKDWKKLHVQIASYNNFPTAAGLACLVFALAKLMNVKEDHGQLSAIARQGSAVLVENEDGSDSMAVQLADENHWDDLVILIAMV